MIIEWTKNLQNQNSINYFKELFIVITIQTNVKKETESWGMLKDIVKTAVWYNAEQGTGVKKN